MLFSCCGSSNVKNRRIVIIEEEQKRAFNQKDEEESSTSSQLSYSSNRTTDSELVKNVEEKFSKKPRSRKSSRTETVDPGHWVHISPQVRFRTLTAHEQQQIFALQKQQGK